MNGADNPQPNLSLNVDPTNPGQFFACCGLLELADRLDDGAVGWFDSSGSLFQLSVTQTDFSSETFLKAICECELVNTMSGAQLDRLASLKSRRVKDLTNVEKAEKKSLESLWRISPLHLGEPFNMRLDWFLDSRSGGSRFKTWAGQQSVIDIASSMRQPAEESAYDDVPVAEWLTLPHGSSLTFNFDSDSSVQGAPLDVGFSLDPLGMSSSSKPLMEFLGFVGLQRFRPFPVSRKNQYVYGLWERPLSPASAALATSQVVDVLVTERYSFPLLYRTKYLKSFLPAQRFGDSL